MKRIIVEKVSARIFNALAILLFGLLFALSISSSWVNEWSLASEHVSPVPDSLIFNGLWLLAVVLIGSLLYLPGKACKVRINMDLFAAAVSLIALVFSVYWVGASNTAPQADQVIICNYAEAFDRGDVSGLTKGGYIGINPQQLGTLTFIRVLYRLFGTGNYAAFQYFNAVMIPVLIFSGYQIVKKLSGNSRAAEGIYLMLMLACVPLYCYVPFVYGEVSSTALVMLAAWMFLAYLEPSDRRKGISILQWGVMSLAIGGAVLLRQNALIFLIAFFVVIVVKLLRKPTKKLIASACGLLLGVVLFQGAIKVIYDPLTPEDSHGMPAILYITMGVNDNNGIAGWHNWYNMNTFAENDHDVARASAAARADLGQFFGKCADDPGYAVDFYYLKMSSQWNVPMYQCLAMNNFIVGEQSELAAEVYFGELRKTIEDVMNIYQLLIYGGILFLLVVCRKKWVQIENYLLLIGVFGGFLFTLMWEAKSRYAFPYFVMMIPYAAVGIYACIRLLSEKCKCILRKK